MMKKSLHQLLTLTITLLIFNAGYAQQDLKSMPACDNEDFETGVSGILSNSTAVQGWLAYRLTYPMPYNANCAAMSNTLLAKNNPTNTALMSVTNGLVDSLIGSTYPIYSMFGSGVSNGGELYNPGIPEMKGNNFLRLNRAKNAAGSYEIIEKTFTITQANALFRIAYIPVLQTGVSCCEGPSFQIKFFSAASGTAALPCPSYSMAIPQSTNFTCTDTSGVNAITSSTFIIAYYHKWRIMAADLSPFIGSTITCKIGSFFCGNSGCPKYSYAYIDAQCSPMEILVNNTPFPAHTNTVTFNGCGLQTATVVAPPNFSSYQWSGPGGFTSTLSTITTSAAGIYTLNIFASGTCTSITKFVDIKMFPAPSVSIASTKTIACRGDVLKLSASGLTSYTWNVPGNTATITVSPANTSTYTVSGYDLNGCLGTASITQSVNSCAGINEYSAYGNISVFPNPNKGEFILHMNYISSAKLTLSSITGQIVHTQNVSAGENKVILNNLVNGFYYYKLEVNGKLYATGKIHIE